ncbi:MAG: hypothetical protein ACREDM_00090 [Methylocella sp.]
MTVKAARFAAAFLLLVIAFMHPALSQPSSSSRQSKASQSSGLKATIGKLSVFTNAATKGLAIQLVLENITRNRIYLFITGDSRASLSDGNSLTLREVIGLTYCRILSPPEQATKFCLDSHGMDLNYYSYIDAGETADLSLRYSLDNVSSGYTPSGSLSFRLIMASRVAHALPNSLEAQADPKSITSPQVVILNFPLTPLNVSVD